MQRGGLQKRDGWRFGWGMLQATSAAQSVRLSRLSASFIMRDPEIVRKIHQGSAASLTLWANFMIREPEIVGRDRIADHGRPSNGPASALAPQGGNGPAGPGPIDALRRPRGRRAATAAAATARHLAQSQERVASGPSTAGSQGPPGCPARGAACQAVRVPARARTRMDRRSAWASGCWAGPPSRRSASAAWAHPLRRARARAKRGQG